MIVGVGLAAATVAAVVAARGSLARRQEARDRDTAAVRMPSAWLGEARTPATPAGNADELATQLAAGRAVIGGLAFTGATDTLDPSSDVALGHVARVLASTPGTFLVEAHVPPSGDVIADQSLSDGRATVVRARLVAAGIPATRVLAMGFGATRSASTSSQARIELSRMP